MSFSELPSSTPDRIHTQPEEDLNISLDQHELEESDPVTPPTHRVQTRSPQNKQTEGAVGGTGVVVPPLTNNTDTQTVLTNVTQPVNQPLVSQNSNSTIQNSTDNQQRLQKPEQKTAQNKQTTIEELQSALEVALGNLNTLEDRFEMLEGLQEVDITVDGRHDQTDLKMSTDLAILYMENFIQQLDKITNYIYTAEDDIHRFEKLVVQFINTRCNTEYKFMEASPQGPWTVLAYYDVKILYKMITNVFCGSFNNCFKLEWEQDNFVEHFIFSTYCRQARDLTPEFKFCEDEHLGLPSCALVSAQDETCKFVEVQAPEPKIVLKGTVVYFCNTTTVCSLFINKNRLPWKIGSYEIVGNNDVGLVTRHKIFLSQKVVEINFLLQSWSLTAFQKASSSRLYSHWWIYGTLLLSLNTVLMCYTCTKICIKIVRKVKDQGRVGRPRVRFSQVPTRTDRNRRTGRRSTSLTDRKVEVMQELRDLSDK